MQPGNHCAVKATIVCMFLHAVIFILQFICYACARYSILIWRFTCCEGSCIHWTSGEHSTSTEPSLVDSETVVYTFLQTIKCVPLMISIQPLLLNKDSTCPPVVDVVLLCVAGSHPCQMHICWEVLWTYTVAGIFWSYITNTNLQLCSIPSSGRSITPSFLYSPAVATTVMV